MGLSPSVSWHCVFDFFPKMVHFECDLGTGHHLAC